MSTVEHSIPAELLLGWDLDIGRWQEAHVTEGEAGAVVERTYWDRSKRTFRGNFTDWGLEGAAYNARLRQWHRFLEHVKNRRSAFYLPEVLTEQHDNVLLGYGDGTRTVFPYPVAGGAIVTTDNMAMVDGTIQPTAAAYVANALPEICAACSDVSATYLTAVGGANFGASTWETRDGLYAIFGNPGTLPYGHEIPWAQLPLAAEGQVWIAMCSLKGNGTFKLEIIFYTAGGTEIGTPESTTQAGTWTQWYDVAKSATAPATTAKVGMRLTRTAGGAENWLVGAQGLARGNAARWWLPSAGMYNVHLAAAPSAGATVTASFLGKRIVRARLDDSKITSGREALGDTTAGFSAIEDWET